MERMNPDHFAHVLFMGPSDWVSNLCHIGLKYDVKDPVPEMVHVGVYLPHIDLVYELTWAGIQYREFWKVYPSILAGVLVPSVDYEVHDRLQTLCSLPGGVTNWTHWFKWRLGRPANVCTTFVLSLLDPFEMFNGDVSPTPSGLYKHLKRLGCLEVEYE